MLKKLIPPAALTALAIFLPSVSFVTTNIRAGS